MVIFINKIVAAFQGMHVSPAKVWQKSVTDGQTDGRTDGWTDRRTTDKVIPMCRDASQATQKSEAALRAIFPFYTTEKVDHLYTQLCLYLCFSKHSVFAKFESKLRTNKKYLYKQN